MAAQKRPSLAGSGLEQLFTPTTAAPEVSPPPSTERPLEAPETRDRPRWAHATRAARSTVLTPCGRGPKRVVPPRARADRPPSPER